MQGSGHCTQCRLNIAAYRDSSCTSQMYSIAVPSSCTLSLSVQGVSVTGNAPWHIAKGLQEFSCKSCWYWRANAFIVRQAIVSLHSSHQSLQRASRSGIGGKIVTHWTSWLLLLSLDLMQLTLEADASDSPCHVPT